MDFQDIDDDWNNFCEDDYKIEYNYDNKTNPSSASKDIPKCSDIYISTRTIISYLNREIDLTNLFWKIPIISYHIPTEGIIKKQMKFNFTSQEEVDNIIKKTEDYTHVDNFIIKRIVNPEGRIKFKDVRKISLGLCKKDITSYRCKQKEAFYNCFVLEMRYYDKIDSKFKEIHIKVFNTGKLEIPGIKTDDMLDNILNLLVKLLKPYTDDGLSYTRNINETVLINSNFNCGYYINREKLYEKLKYKYKINSAYDPCSYPGIQCKFYYDNNLKKQTGHQPSNLLDCNNENNNNIKKMSFMIFRTGSVLIVGKCNEDILKEIYEFLKVLLENEYNNIGDKIISKKMIEQENNIKKNRKIRKKIIIFETTN